MTKANWRGNEIHMGDEETKTWDERIIPITPQIRCWLDVEPWAEWEWSRQEFEAGFNEIGRGAFGEPLPPNCLRHTAATYLYHRHGRAQAALILGNSEQKVENNYKGQIQNKDWVEAFYAITPVFSLQREAVPLPS